MKGLTLVSLIIIVSALHLAQAARCGGPVCMTPCIPGIFVKEVKIPPQWFLGGSLCFPGCWCTGFCVNTGGRKKREALMQRKLSYKKLYIEMLTDYENHWRYSVRDILTLFSQMKDVTQKDAGRCPRGGIEAIRNYTMMCYHTLSRYSTSKIFRVVAMSCIQSTNKLFKKVDDTFTAGPTSGVSFIQANPIEWAIHFRK